MEETMSVAERQLPDKEAENLLAKRYDPPNVVFMNQLKPDSQIHIIQVGCKFAFDDNYNDNKVANVDIAPGGQYTLNSTYGDCCRGYLILIKVRHPDGKMQQMAGSATVPDDYCGGTLKYHLVPKRMVRKGSNREEEPPFELVGGFNDVMGGAWVGGV